LAKATHLLTTRSLRSLKGTKGHEEKQKNGLRENFSGLISDQSCRLQQAPKAGKKHTA
jgi:hypothetical protein